MKPQKWMFGPLALSFGWAVALAPMVMAQDEASIIDVQAKTAGTTTQLPPLSIWDGQASSVSRVGAWGNGSAQANAGRNGTSLLVTTRNFEEGIRFDLNKPIDISPYRQLGFWRLRVQTNAPAQAGGGGRGRGRNPGATAPGTTPAGTSLSGDTAPLSQLRLKLVMENGTISGVIPLAQNGANQYQGQGGGRNRGQGRGGRRAGDDWQTLLLPLRNMVGTPGAGGVVKRLILTGDSTGTFSLEQVALVAETRNITATVRRATDPSGTDITEITAKPGRSVTLMADVNSGTSDVIALWNFNADNNPALPSPFAAQTAGAAPGAGRNPGAAGANAATGANRAGAAARRVDAIGLSVKPNWPNEEGDYRVEVTIADRAGKKATVKKSFLVKIRGSL